MNKINKIQQLSIILIFFLLMSIMFYSCKQNSTPSLYDLAVDKGLTPAISSIEPADEALAGVQDITINGSNFSDSTGNNLVFFNGIKAAVQSATEAKLVVRTPNIISDSVVIKVAKSGASGSSGFSNKIIYKLKQAVFNIFPPENSILLPYAITVDAAGNVYVSATAAGQGVGIKKILPDGTVNAFAPKGGETFFTLMKMGPGNIIFAARKVKAIFNIQEGIAAKTWVTYANGIGSIDALDFDQNKNVWAGGTGNGAIYRITPDKAVKAFNFPEDVTSIRYFNNHLYISSKEGTNVNIWKVEIISQDSLGEPQKYFDFSSNFGGYEIRALDASVNGDIFIGTDAPETIIVLHPDQSFEQFYPGIFEVAAVYAFGSGNDNFLYYTREAAEGDISQAIVKLNIQQQVAPNFGIE